jgi:hypothetical protein
VPQAIACSKDLKIAIQNYKLAVQDGRAALPNIAAYRDLPTDNPMTVLHPVRNHGNVDIFCRNSDFSIDITSFVYTAQKQDHGGAFWHSIKNP